MLSSGVAGGKPGFVGIVCVAPPIPFVGAVVMELAAMTQVPDNINPTTVKPMGVSFMWYSCIVSTTRANVLQRIGFLDKVSLLRIRKKPRNRTNRGF